MRSHAVVLAVTASLLGAAPPPAGGSARPIVRVPSVGQFGTTPDLSSAIVNGVSSGNTPPGEPYFARTAGAGSEPRNPELSFLGTSSEPFDVSMDPRRDAPYRYVYSKCSGTGSSATCSLFTQELRNQFFYPPLATDSVTGTRDRLPSTYGGATAFSRGRGPATVRHSCATPRRSARRHSRCRAGHGERAHRARWGSRCALASWRMSGAGRGHPDTGPRCACSAWAPRPRRSSRSRLHVDA
ncbi:MAG: hypothetical protein QOJ85_3563 [Solirubrobacteraceae bacterium]|nr:hypothetical protein [Solirubrobacteraceae bacterium]